ncbi:hypothetical protein KPZU09_10770 [Klebsiella pneumoniae]|uniref:Uncharacterized protein n=1 Tax=Klebsiella pneumoniae TaxID=573 RepID=A0A919LLK6_KLEPN|nr:hypothetical protein KPZU09_10770 [Klebsiella pneumoniae]
MSGSLSASTAFAPQADIGFQSAILAADHREQALAPAGVLSHQRHVEHLADQADENLRFQLADGGEVVVQLPGGHRASRAICRTVMAAKPPRSAAHGGLHNPFPSRITL